MPPNQSVALALHFVFNREVRLTSAWSSNNRQRKSEVKSDAEHPPH